VYSDKKTLLESLEIDVGRETLCDFLEMYSKYYDLEQPLYPPKPPCQIEYTFRPWTTKKENDRIYKRYNANRAAYAIYIKNYWILKEIKSLKTMITKLQNKQ